MSNRDLVVAVFADAGPFEKGMLESAKATKVLTYAVGDMAAKNVAAMEVQLTKIQELAASYKEMGASAEAGSSKAIAIQKLLGNAQRKLGIEVTASADEQVAAAARQHESLVQLANDYRRIGAAAEEGSSTAIAASKLLEDVNRRLGVQSEATAQESVASLAAQQNKLRALAAEYRAMGASAAAGSAEAIAAQKLLKDANRQLGITEAATAAENIAAEEAQIIQLRELAAEYRLVADSAVAGSAKQLAALNLLKGANSKLGIAEEGSGRILDTLSRRMILLGRTMTMYVTVPIVAATALATKMFINFQRHMEMIHTQAGASQEEVTLQTPKVLALAKSTSPVGPQDLAQGLYHLESIGLRGAKAMNALKIASDAAGLGIANMEEVSTALGGALVTDIRGTQNLNDAMGTINATIGAGNMRMDDFAAALSTGVLPAAKDMGLGLDEVGAALAVLTDRGMGAQLAATRLRMSFSMMANPTDSAKKALADLGIESTTLARLMRSGPDGFTKALELVHAGMDKLKNKTRATSDVLDAFGKGRSSAAILALINSISSATSSYQGKLEQIRQNSKNFTEDVAAYHQTASYKISHAWASIQASLIKVGGSVAPVVVTFVRGINSIVNAIGKLPKWFSKSLGIGLLAFATLGPVLLIVGKLVRAFIDLGIIVGKMGKLFIGTAATEVAAEETVAVAATETNVVIGAEQAAAAAEGAAAVETASVAKDASIAVTTEAAVAENVAIGEGQVAAAAKGAAGVEAAMAAETASIETATVAATGLFGILGAIAALGVITVVIDQIVNREIQGTPITGKTGKKEIGGHRGIVEPNGLITYYTGGKNPGGSPQAVSYDPKKKQWYLVGYSDGMMVYSDKKITPAQAAKDLHVKVKDLQGKKYGPTATDPVDRSNHPGWTGNQSAPITPATNPMARYINELLKAQAHAQAVAAAAAKNQAAGEKAARIISRPIDLNIRHLKQKEIADRKAKAAPSVIEKDLRDEIRHYEVDMKMISETMKHTKNKFERRKLQEEFMKIKDMLGVAQGALTGELKTAADKAARESLAAAKAIIGPLGAGLRKAATEVQAAIKRGDSPSVVADDIRKEIALYKEDIAKVKQDLKTASGPGRKKLQDELAKLQNGLTLAQAALASELKKIATELGKVGLTLDKALDRAYTAQLKKFNANLDALQMLKGIDIPGYKTDYSAQITNALTDERKVITKEIATITARLKKATGAAKTALQSTLKKLTDAQTSINAAWEQNLKDTISDLQSSYQTALQKFDTAFGRVVQDVTSAFEKQTQDYITKVIGPKFYQNGAQTPTEKLIQQIQDAQSADERKKAITDAKLQYINDISAGADKSTILSDKLGIKSAQNAEMISQLQIKATQERADADEAYAKAVEEYTDQRTIEERQLSDALADLQDKLEQGTASLSDLDAILSKYGINLDAVNKQLYGFDIGAASDAFSGPNGLISSIKALQQAFNVLITWINTTTGSNIGVISVGDTGSGASGSGSSSGVTRIAGGGAGGTHAVPMAAGGIVFGPTFAMVGESGPEAVIPLDRLAGGGGGGGDLHIHFDGPVLGADMQKVARELEPHIRTAIQKTQRRNSHQVLI